MHTGENESPARGTHAPSQAASKADRIPAFRRETYVCTHVPLLRNDGVAQRAALSLIEVAPGLNSVPRETLSIFKLSLSSLFFINLTRDFPVERPIAWLGSILN